MKNSLIKSQFENRSETLTIASQLLLMLHQQVNEGVALFAPKDVSVASQICDGNLDPAPCSSNDSGWLRSGIKLFRWQLAHLSPVHFGEQENRNRS